MKKEYQLLCPVCGGVLMDNDGSYLCLLCDAEFVLKLSLERIPTYVPIGYIEPQENDLYP